MLDDPLPTLTKIVRQTANDARRPSLDDDPSAEFETMYCEGQEGSAKDAALN